MTTTEKLEYVLNVVEPYAYPVTAVVVLVLCAVALWLVYYRWASREYPPGPVGVPFLGYLPFLSERLHEDFDRQASKYGDIFYLKIGRKNVVVLNNLDLIEEAFVEQADIFSGRGDSFLRRKLWSGQSGILMSEGKKWSSLRQFAIEHLKKEDAFAAVERETLELVAVLKTEAKKSHETRTFFIEAVANMIMQMTLKMRKAYQDDNYQSYVANFTEVSDLIHETSPMDFVPPIIGLPVFGGRLKNVKEKFEVKMKLIKSFLRESRGSENPSEFTSDFLVASTDNEKNVEQSEYFTENELVMVLNDLWGASTETTTSVLQWALLYMIKFPDIQMKVQSELDKIVGHPKTRLITWDDKENLPFTLSTMYEVQRCASITPFGVSHCNVKETKLDGYIIPKRSVVIPNFWRINRDKRYWTEPLVFNPDRFLAAENTVEVPAAFLPFSIGPRSCPFQMIGSAQLFIIFANLMHRFDFQIAKDESLPKEDDYVTALTIRPKEFNFVANPRFEQLLSDHLQTRAA